MASYDEELLTAARSLLRRGAGQRGKLPSARIRRSISTSYYALFHFLLEEVGSRMVGTSNDLLRRRRIFVRTLSHKGVKAALEKVGAANVDRAVQEFFRRPRHPAGIVVSPAFAQDMARAFLDAQAKRHDADYDLNKPLSEADARLLRDRVKDVTAAWRKANSPSDKDFKYALCLLMTLGGQLRRDN